MSTPLEVIARRVNWYTETAQALGNIHLFLSQVMARGSTEDIVAVSKQYSQDEFRTAYLHAPPGLFSKRSWAYWGLMLFDDPHRALPERFPGANQFDWRKATGP